MQMELDETLKISLAALQTFILSARAKMVDNPYHNWTHSVDVTQVSTIVSHVGSF